MRISDNEKHAPILSIISGRNKLLLLNYLTKNLRVYSHVNMLSYFIMKKTNLPWAYFSGCLYLG